jgi:hypothetical protein
MARTLHKANRKYDPATAGGLAGRGLVVLAQARGTTIQEGTAL